MLTISSIGVAPRPQQTPVVASPPVAIGRVGAGRDNAGGVIAVPSGDGTGVQTTALPTSLPPVASPNEAAFADLPKNAQVLAPRESDLGPRFKGELPPEPKSPVDEALDQKIEQYIPNLWKASRAAVDAMGAQLDKTKSDGGVEGMAEPAANVAKDLPYATAQETAGKPTPTPPGSLLDVEA